MNNKQKKMEAAETRPGSYKKAGEEERENIDDA